MQYVQFKQPYLHNVSLYVLRSRSLLAQIYSQVEIDESFSFQNEIRQVEIRSEVCLKCNSLGNVLKFDDNYLLKYNITVMEIIDDDIGDSLIWAATRGHTSFLAKQLASVKQPEKYVNYVYDCDRSQKRTILTTAAMFGHENFVRYFLENFNPDIEALSDVIFEDDSNDEQLCLGVSALWAAAAANHLSIVKILVEHGANVNQTTSTNSTALRSACYNGNIIMVRYLISNGADVRIAKKNNDTNLAVTVYRKHLELSKYLVEELGCDVNQCDDDGRSPLFDAVNGGSLELTTFLLAHGARNRPAISDRMTPLMWAAEKSRSDLVDAIGESCSILEQIEAEELLGSALICCDLTKRRPHQAIEHWSRALQLRGLYNIHKELKTSSLPFKEKHEECRTVNDLKRYPTCLDSIWIEALLVRERILGVKNGEYRYSVQYQGAVLLDNQHFDQGLSLWLYEARIRVDNNISFSTQYFHNFISLFCEMLYKNIFVSQSTIQFIFDLTMKQLEIDNTNFDTYFQILLYLITVYSKVPANKIFKDLSLLIY